MAGTIFSSGTKPAALPQLKHSGIGRTKNTHFGRSRYLLSDTRKRLLPLKRLSRDSLTKVNLPISPVLLPR